MTRPWSRRVSMTCSYWRPPDADMVPSKPQPFLWHSSGDACLSWSSTRRCHSSRRRGPPFTRFLPSAPQSSQMLERSLDALRHHLSPPPVGAPSQSPPPLLGQGHVIAGNLGALESAALLEFGQRIVAPEKVDQVL